MSLVLKKLKIRNFLSFGNNITEIDLDQTGTILIHGENLDTGGNNGCGKTSIINAISFALFNKAISNISKERLINNINAIKQTEMMVSLEFDINNDTYEIIRYRGKKNDVKIIKNGDIDNPITPDSIANTDKFIVNLIGISYELFKKAVIFRGSDLSFFEIPAAQQKAIIEEMFNISILTDKALLLKDKMSDTSKNIEITEAVIKSQEESANLLKKNISDAEKRIVDWETNKESKLKKLNEELSFIDTIDFDKEFEILKNIKELNDILIEKKQSLSTLQLRKTELNNLISDISGKISRNNSKISSLESELQELENNTCPYCKQSFKSNDKINEIKQCIINNKENNDDLNKELNELEELKIGIDSEYNQLNDEIDDLDKDKKLLENNTLYTNEQELVSIKGNYDIILKDIKDLENDENPHIEVFESLKDNVIDNIDYAKLDKLYDDLNHEKFLYKLLTDKKSFIRKAIIDKSIPFLNQRLVEYTSILGLPHLVKFESSMKCSIHQFDRELDYGNLSGGEQKRINLSLSLAFRDVLQHFHNKVNILVCDEIDGGSTDPVGIELLIKLLKEKASTDDIGIWIVSHSPLMNNRFDRSIVVQKENGFSKILN